MLLGHAGTAGFAAAGEATAALATEAPLDLEQEACEEHHVAFGHGGLSCPCKTDAYASSLRHAWRAFADEEAEQIAASEASLSASSPWMASSCCTAHAALQR